MNSSTRTVLALAVALFLFPYGSVAQEAERWVSVGTEAGADVELDTASVIEIDPDVSEAWIREVLSEPRVFLVDRYDRKLLLRRYDCRFRRQRLMWLRLHDGERLVQDRRSADTRWQPISPESIEESLWRRVCRVT